MVYKLSKKDKKLVGSIHLDGSKSISNRVLIIRALAKADAKIEHLSTSKDTVTLQALLEQSGPEATLDAGAAGTTFRFMTAFLSRQTGTQTLTGSERMKQRPIGVLVDALRKLGANIDYLEREGYPPLKIGEATFNETNQLDIPASVSSQYISALLMLAPTLPEGLSLTLTGKIVSRPYIEMTLRIMDYFGVRHEWNEQTIQIKPQTYQFKDFKVEADWSAASYYYAFAAFADPLDLQLDGLFEESLQGDAVLAEMMTQFGIRTTFNETGLRLSREQKGPERFSWDFIRCPDIAQTLAVICAGLGTRATLTGLETLRIKETDRITALQNELVKVLVRFYQLPAEKAPDKEQEYFQTAGKAQINRPIFDTYEDHRMAMAFAPFAMFAPISIQDPMVVRKSYPLFYEDLKTLGFEVLEA